MNVQIDRNPRNGCELFLHRWFANPPGLPRHSGPTICTSMGGRRAEVQDLADHVGGQEGEGRRRKLPRQVSRSFAHLLGGRAVSSLQR